jgi:hypothetical protein
MYFSKSDIFWKCWWWSLLCGAAVAVLFYAVTSPFKLGSLGSQFFDILIVLSIAGCYFGAGYVGWRIADKHRYDHDGSFVRRYRKYSIVTLLALMAVLFSSLSFLGVFWSLIPPFGVLYALGDVKVKPKKKPKRR